MKTAIAEYKLTVYSDGSIKTELINNLLKLVQKN